jgi:hypothetical protein
MGTRQDDGELVPLDKETLDRLDLFAHATGRTPAQAAAALLRDLLFDKDFWISAGLRDGAMMH